MKVLKVKKDREGREYYTSGKRKTKHFLEGKARRRRGSRRSRRGSRRRSRGRRRRSFGYMKNSLLDIMGNFQPPAMMSLAQSTTGMSAPQMIGHIGGIPKSLRSNFYTNIR